MNNKKIALVIFIVLLALLAVGAGVLFNLGRDLHANLSNQDINEKDLSASVLVAETDFEKCGKFNDVNSTKNYCWLTRIMRDRNIFTGDANGNFRPTDNISRAEFAKVLVVTLYGNSITLANPATLDGATLGFADLSGTHWAYPYIKVAKEKGLIGGYPDGTFRMGNNVTRAEFAKMLYSKLPDLQAKINEAKSYFFNETLDQMGLTAGQWYTDYMLMLHHSDNWGAFLENHGDGKLYPERLVNRLEIAAAVHHLTIMYQLTIGFGEGDITNEVSAQNCEKIRNLTDMTATLKNYGIPATVMTQCAKTYPNIWMQSGNTPMPEPKPAASDITAELTAENCLKITRLANMTATLQSLGIGTGLLAQCASAYPAVWNKCGTMLEWKTTYGTSGLSSRMSSANPPFTSEDSIQCANKFGSTWHNTQSI